MSERKTAHKKGSVAILMLAVAATLILTAAGALAITSGLWPVDRAWLWVCFAWCCIGYICCRHIAVEGPSRIFQIAVRFGIAIAAAWIVGLATGEGSGLTSHWIKYIISYLSGTVLALMISPKKSKHRKKHKTATYKAQRRSDS